MNLKMKKKIENERLFYLVADGNKSDVYYEFYEYPNYKETPNIENICYKQVGTELITAFKQKDFNDKAFKTILFVIHGIIINGNVIDISSAKNLSKVIDNIRYKDLYNVINSFRKKLSITVLEYFKNKILEIKVSELSSETQSLFEKFLLSVSYSKDPDALFKEVLFLSIINEYHRAYVKVYEIEQRILKFQDDNLDDDED